MMNRRFGVGARHPGVREPGPLLLITPRRHAELFFESCDEGAGTVIAAGQGGVGDIGPVAKVSNRIDESHSLPLGLHGHPGFPGEESLQSTQ